jgi:hypothetical protein
MNSKVKYLFLLGALSAFVACSGGGGGSGSAPAAAAPQTTEVASVNYKSGNCSPQVVDDYDDVSTGCHDSETMKDAVRCKLAVQSFLEKYPGIHCDATKPGYETVNVSSVKLQRMLDKLADLGF